MKVEINAESVYTVFLICVPCSCQYKSNTETLLRLINGYLFAHCTAIYICEATVKAKRTRYVCVRRVSYCEVKCTKA